MDKLRKNVKMMELLQNSRYCKHFWNILNMKRQFWWLISTQKIWLYYKIN